MQNYYYVIIYLLLALFNMFTFCQWWCHKQHQHPPPTVSYQPFSRNCKDKWHGPFYGRDAIPVPSMNTLTPISILLLHNINFNIFIDLVLSFGMLRHFCMHNSITKVNNFSFGDTVWSVKFQVQYEIHFRAPLYATSTMAVQEAPISMSIWTSNSCCISQSMIYCQHQRCGVKSSQSLDSSPRPESKS